MSWGSRGVYVFMSSWGAKWTVMYCIRAHATVVCVFSHVTHAFAGAHLNVLSCTH